MGASMLRETVANSYKDAMKARDRRRVGALRLIQAAFKERDIEARGAGKGQASEDELLQTLAKMVRQREESIRLYEQGGRPELAEQERNESRSSAVSCRSRSPNPTSRRRSRTRCARRAPGA